MPSTNKLSSRIRGNSLLGPRSHIARFLYTFCGIFASFGVVTKALVAGIVLLATFAIPVSITSLILSSSNNAYATGNSSNSNTVSATLPGSVAIRLLNAVGTAEISSLDFNLTPTASGTSATQSMIVDVATSNPTGYKLYMQSNYQDSSSNYTTNLVHTTNGVPDVDISDVIPTSTSASTLYWNYINPLLNANVEDPSSRVASVIPAHGSPDKLDQYFSTTNSRQTEVSFNVSVDTTIVSGTYENQLLFSAVGNPTTVAYKVTFDPDGGTQTETEIEETAAAGTHSMAIPTTSDYIPTKASYLFDHWQIIIPNGSDVTATCNNTDICHPGDNIVITTDEEFRGDVTLKANYIQTITTISKMQDMTAEVCANTTMGDSATLEDIRDNNTYTVRKLKDGNCWMTQNLEILGGRTLNSENTDVTEDVVLPETISDIFDTSNDFRIRKKDANGYGPYYNWYTATAASGTESIVSGEAQYSICPKGWRLPTGGDSGDFSILYKYYPTLQLLMDEPGYSMSGDYGRDLNDECGSWYSSTAEDEQQSRRLFIDAGGTISIDKYVKSQGRSVRCLTKNMQGVLTVNPSGGTWEGSSETQTITQDSGSSIEISDPTSTDTYTITYNDSNLGATIGQQSETSIPRSFFRWVPSGFGILSDGVYTFGAGEGTLTAEYSPISDKFTLPTITKSGYTCGWTTDNGTSYASGQEDITVTGDTTFIATCTSPAFGNITKMQEMTPEICESNAIGTTKTLTDTRDNKTYTIKRLNDGNCWMTQNLRLVGSVELNSSNSDVAESFTLPAFTSDNFNANTELRFLDTGNTNYGVYYNWYTATAKSYTQTITGVAPYSICSKGWKLPSWREFYNLMKLYPASEEELNNKMITGAPAFIMAGQRKGTTTSDQGLNGYYWSNNANTSSSSNGLLVNATSNDSLGRGWWVNGYPIRCVADGMSGGNLIVDPNGGTWNGSTEKQTFSQKSGTTKTISNPTSNPVQYTITYDDNGQGATFDESPTSVSTYFMGWALSGSGSISGGSYEFGNGSSTIVAEYGYRGSQSKTFVLPTITKAGSYCTWHEGSPTGRELFSGQTNMTVTDDTTYYASCTTKAFDGISTMQQMTPTICEKASVGDIATLTDIRDNKTYNIRKLKDGKCWMVQDLALTAPSGGKLTSATSNVASDVTWGTNSSTCVNTTDWCVVDNYSDPANGYGVHYNYYVATVKTGPVNTDASQSICPKGWKLPSTNGVKTDFQLLVNNYSTADLLQSVEGPNLRRSGWIEYDTYRSLGSRAIYLSSTAQNSSFSYALEDSDNSGSVNPSSNIWYGAGGTRKNGAAIRCVAEGYDVNISNSNTTSSVSSIDVSYGSSVAITVTPNSNYYLSSVNCPSGYTCSGYSTGVSATGTQTVTITNNDTKSGGTLTFTASPNLQQSCADASTGATFTYDGKQYIKLKTNSAGTTTACYTKSSQGNATYANASSLCPSGTSIPSQTDFSNLTSAYGTSSALNTATGWGPSSSYTYYWTSTTYTSGYNYALRIRTSAANVTYRTTSGSSGVLCKVN